jgi:alkylated DNA repair dioxygenase AlkB
MLERYSDHYSTLDIARGAFPGLFDLIHDVTPWEQKTITLYGETHDVPRLTAWYGDPGMTYHYSGIVNHPHPWTGRLNEIKREVERMTGATFNSCLLNLYQHGKHHVSLHADDEPGLVIGAPIASVSLGGTRRFRVVRNIYPPPLKKRNNYSLELRDGDLVVMGGDFQTHWKHGISKTTKEVDPRINLTFRKFRK